MTKALAKALEAELLNMEKNLEEMGWVRLECDHWEDPLTGSHESTMHAWDVAMQLRKQK